MAIAPRSCKLSALLALVAVSLWGSCAWGTDDVQVEDLLRRGHVADSIISYIAAESLYSAACTELERLPDATDILFDTYLRLATIQTYLSQLPQAKSTFERALLLATTHWGAENTRVAACLNGLGNLQYIYGNYGPAERLCRKALSIAEGAGGPDHPEVGVAACHLSFICRRQNRYEEGKVYARRAIAIARLHAERSAEELALGYVALGWNHRGHGFYNDAQNCFLQAHAVAQAAYHDNHPVCAVIYDHMAGLAVNLIDGDRGLLNANRALEIVERLQGPANLEAGWAHWYRQRALMYLGRLEEAVQEGEAARRIFSQHVGELHPDVANILGFQANCYRLMNRFDEAMKTTWDAGAITLNNYHENSLHLADPSAVLAALSTFDAYSEYAAFYFDNPNPTTEQSQRLAELIVASSGITDDAMYTRAQMQRGSLDSAGQRLVARLGIVRARRSALYFRDPRMSDPPVRDELANLTSQEKDILADLAVRGLKDEFSEFPRNATVAEVCRLIPPGASVIDFYHFRYVKPSLPPEKYNEDSKTAAVVLDHDGVRGHVRIADWLTVVDTLNAWQELMARRAGGSEWSVRERRRFDRLSRELYLQFWQPLTEFISAGDLVMISPDLIVGTLPFGALVRPDGKYLIESQTIQYLNSPRDLARFRPESERGYGLFAAADPDFNATPQTRLASAKEDEGLWNPAPSKEFAVRNVRPGCVILDSLKLDSLPNTRYEVKRIEQLLEAGSSEPVHAYFGASANEEAVKRILPGNRLVHLATHGYFVPQECRGGFSPTGWWHDYPYVLLYSGLLLAGANLSGKDAEELGAEDGILTADEVMALDLDGVDLVVLSACETGLGEPSPGQGTFGIARAFQIAGARQVVSSLWPVSDAVSARMMSGIYSSDNRSVCEKLRRVAIEMIETDRREGRQPDPFYWAPFISSGDWRTR